MSWLSLNAQIRDSLKENHFRWYILSLWPKKTQITCTFSTIGQNFDSLKVSISMNPAHLIEVCFFETVIRDYLCVVKLYGSRIVLSQLNCFFGWCFSLFLTTNSWLLGMNNSLNDFLGANSKYAVWIWFSVCLKRFLLHALILTFKRNISTSLLNWCVFLNLGLTNLWFQKTISFL